MIKNNCAVVARIKTTPHPNANRLKLGRVCGSQVVVGIDTVDGELGLFFPEGLQLSTEFATANDLIRRKDEDGNQVGGMFEENRRVRTQKFRGAESNGFFCPLSHLEFTGYDTKKLKDGDNFTELNGVPICNKYVTPATQRAAFGRSKNKTRVEVPMMKKHKDTQQLCANKDLFENGDTLYISRKIHGTSQRVGHVQVEIKKKWYHKLMDVLGILYQKTEWKYLVGSRNVILQEGQDGYYTDSFRQQAAAPFIGLLPKGVSVYFEVCGWQDENTPIMGRVSTKGDKDLQRMYGNEVIYSYGCPPGKHENYVYRVTISNEDGEQWDLPWVDVKKFCNTLGVKHVPDVCQLQYDGDFDALIRLIEDEINGPDKLDSRHPSEGVVVRTDGANPSFFKHKSWAFKYLEGIIKDKPDYVDLEEVS